VVNFPNTPMRRGGIFINVPVTYIVFFRRQLRCVSQYDIDKMKTHPVDSSYMDHIEYFDLCMAV
jgi:hypothetical protein